MGAVLLMVMAAPAMVSCGDDDNIDLGTPQYEGISGKYTIDTPSSPYESIELGASGDYIVVEKGSYLAGVGARSGERVPQGVFGQAEAASRATDYNGVIYGRYTQQADGTLNLEGFGIVEIVYGSGEEVIGFNLTPTGGGRLELDVTKAEVMPDDDKTNAICRTWKIERIRDVYYDKETGKTDDITVTPENPGEEGYDMPVEVLWSKSGTYLISYLDNSIGLAEWKWRDRSKGTMYYAWDGDWTGDYATITFDGNRAVVHDKWEDDYGRDESWTYMVAED